MERISSEFRDWLMETIDVSHLILKYSQFPALLFIRLPLLQKLFRSHSNCFSSLKFHFVSQRWNYSFLSLALSLSLFLFPRFYHLKCISDDSSASINNFRCFSTDNEMDWIGFALQSKVFQFLLEWRWSNFSFSQIHNHSGMIAECILLRIYGMNGKNRASKQHRAKEKNGSKSKQTLLPRRLHVSYIWLKAYILSTLLGKVLMHVIAIGK